MKKNNLYFIIIIFIVLLICFILPITLVSHNENKYKNDNNKDDQIKYDSKYEEKEIALTNNYLIDNLFITYSEVVGELNWDSANENLDDKKFEIEIIEPSDDVIGKIKIFDENNNYIFLSFYPKNGNEILSMLTYESSDGNYELSVNNNYHTTSNKYTFYNKNDDVKSRKYSTLRELINAYNFYVNE